MNSQAEIAISIFIIAGSLFALVGSAGLIKLSDFMTRLHSPTKATTLGVGSMLVASMIFFYASQGTLSINELLITFFLFLTAPISAHFMAKAYLHLNFRTSKDSLPRPHGSCDWSTFEKPCLPRADEAEKSI